MTNELGLEYADAPTWKPTSLREAWYKLLLKTGVFDVYFRSLADHQRYTSLSLKDRPFLLTELAEETQG